MSRPGAWTNRRAELDDQIERLGTAIGRMALVEPEDRLREACREINRRKLKRHDKLMCFDVVDPLRA